MVALSLPDGSVKEFDQSVTGLALAESIGPGLAQAALAIKVNGTLQDLTTTITENAEVAIVTTRDDEGLEVLRHSCAHLMAQAVQELFPGTQVTIGPSIENGFYYDFARKDSFTPEDFEKIESKMGEIVDRNEEITRDEWSREDTIKFFEEKGEAYKVEIIKELPEGETISVYKQGDFTDLCRGPHVPSTGKIGKAFKLMKLAGAYWRGNAKNEMLQRIYGTVWADKKALRQHLNMLEEAEKRDHRRLGREMDLFHFQEEAPGAVFWHPRGWTMFRKLMDYMRQCNDQADYEEVYTPTVMDRVLWETSGHWEKFREHMYLSEMEDGRTYCVKPMNCPGGIQVFKQGITSYRDLPRRISEFGKVHRYEHSGALHGLMRVREFIQDDAHVFCTPEQLEQECQTIVQIILDIYKSFGFDNVRIKFSDRPEKRIGEDKDWDNMEHALKAALKNMGLDCTLNPGEGAFYGPKLEFVLRDAIGRDWQCGTLQVDPFLPKRFDAYYIGEDGEKHYPIMLHRALFGSLERFAGILIEHHAGRLPVWLSPVQVMVTTITSDADDYALDVLAALKKAGLRADVDLRNEKINYKVREHSHAKIPALFVVGRKEAENGAVAVRRLGGKTQEVLALDEAIAKLKVDAEMPILG